MAIVLVGLEAFPSYIALSTDLDLSGSKVIGVPTIGKTIYITDTKAWYITTGASGSYATMEKFVMPKLET